MSAVTSFGRARLTARGPVAAQPRAPAPARAVHSASVGNGASSAGAVTLTAPPGSTVEALELEAAPHVQPSLEKLCGALLKKLQRRAARMDKMLDTYMQAPVVPLVEPESSPPSQDDFTVFYEEMRELEDPSARRLAACAAAQKEADAIGTALEALSSRGHSLAVAAQQIGLTEAASARVAAVRSRIAATVAEGLPAAASGTAPQRVLPSGACPWRMSDGDYCLQHNPDAWWAAVCAAAGAAADASAPVSHPVLGVGAALDAAGLLGAGSAAAAAPAPSPPESVRGNILPVPRGLGSGGGGGSAGDLPALALVAAATAAAAVNGGGPALRPRRGAPSAAAVAAAAAAAAASVAAATAAISGPAPSRRGSPLSSMEVNEPVRQVQSVRPIPSNRAATAKLSVAVQCPTKFGEALLLCGSLPALGAWAPEGALAAVWSEGDVWRAEVDVPVGELIEFKALLKASDGTLTWEAGHNKRAIVNRPGDRASFMFGFDRAEPPSKGSGGSRRR